MWSNLTFHTYDKSTADKTSTQKNEKSRKVYNEHSVTIGKIKMSLRFQMSSVQMSHICVYIYMVKGSLMCRALDGVTSSPYHQWYQLLVFMGTPIVYL